MFNHRFGFLMVMLSVIFCSRPAAAARPSFSGDDTIDDVTVTLNGVEQSFTVLRDAQRAGQYYYIPNEPRLFEQVVDGESRPEFLLVRYQAVDPGNPENFQEAGLLQFSVRLSLPPEATEQLQEAVVAKVGDVEGPIVLSALRIKSAKVNLYNDDGTLLGRNAMKDFVGPTFASQKIAFQVPLTKLGADVYDALVNGDTGVYVNFTLEYEGLTPPVGVSCQVDWEKAHRLYSKDTSFAAKASYLGLLNTSSNIDKHKIKSRLETEQAIRCKGISGDGFNADSAAQKIINYVNNKLIKDFNPPDKIEVPKVDKNKKGSKLGKLSPKRLFGFGGSGSYAVKLYDLERVRKVKATYDMSYQSVEVRKTSVSGFVGIGRYPESIRESAVVDVASGQWGKTYFGLPTVSPETGLTRVDYQVQLDTSPPQSQVATWRPGKGWTDLKGRARNSLAFGLLGVDNGPFGLRFEETIQLSLPNDVLRVKTDRKAVSEVNGTPLPLALALQPVDVVTIYTDNLSFSRLVPGSPLASVRVTLISGERQLHKTIRPPRINGTYSVPDLVVWLVPKGAPVTADIEFVRSDRRGTSKWSGGSVDLRASASLDVELFDIDWRER